MRAPTADTYPRDPPAAFRNGDFRSSHRGKRGKPVGAFIQKLIDVQIGLIALLALVVAGGIPFGIRPYCIISSSMEPTLPRGSLIYVDTCVHPDTLETGTAVAFLTNQGQTVVTHRIYDKDQDTGNYITKGDANSSADPSEVSPSQIIGEVRGCIPYLGSLLSTDKATLALAFGGVALADLALAGLSRRLDTLPSERVYK